MPVEFAPEAPHVLAQLAQHEIAAVASEVGLFRCVFGPRQQPVRIALRSEQWARRVEPVFVGVTEQELAETGEVVVLEPIVVAERALALPVDLRLREAVGEPERLRELGRGRRQTLDALEARRALSFDLALQRRQATGYRIQEH